jgi:DNA-binding NtrC family response regulator
VLGVILAEDAHDITEAAGVAEARHAIASHRFDCVLTDQQMADGQGLVLLQACRDADPTLPVVVMTAYASVELAVEAMRQGAFDFISKPFTPEVVRAAVQRACDRAALLRENARLKGEVERLGWGGRILGDSAAMASVREQLGRVAPTTATVLITGETGTGKELVARAIHAASPRARGPFMAVNCGAMTETLLESELFGHERGAFTGADRSRAGVFEAAHRGTLFLDEAGEMSLGLQAKLLRVLTDGVLTRVGSTTSRTVDVRVLVATHRDLEQRVRQGTFREDLYYRIAVVPIHIPPLRERREDIGPLLDHFLRASVADLKVPRRGISAEARAWLEHYDYPGNVRELRNLIERAQILARGDTLGLGDFGVAAAHGTASGAGEARRRDWVASLPPSIELRTTVEEVERMLIERALKAAGGVQAEAARGLGLTRSDIAYKIRKYGIETGGA